MRITYFLPGWGHTGGSQVLYKFMDKLCERGHTVHAVTPQGGVGWQPGYSVQAATGGAGPQGLRGILKNIAKRYFPVEKLQEQWPSAALLRLSRLNQVLLRNWERSEITVATIWWTAYASFALSESTVPLYHMQHWEEVFYSDEVRRQMARLTYRLPLGLMANCSWLRETVRRRVGRDSWLLFPGVDTQVFYPRIGLRDKFVNLQKVRVLSYYSPVPFKGWSDGVEAMRKVFSTVGRERVEWVVYGGQPCGHLDVPATFVGRMFGESLAELYSSAHIVFMPSWYESFPLPPIEAMASGAAVIVTGTGAEDYAFDGHNALVRPGKNPDELANAILELIARPVGARELAEEGLRTARALTWDAATDRLEAILEEAARKPNVCHQPAEQSLAASLVS